MRQYIEGSKIRFLIGGLATSLFLALGAIEARQGNSVKVFLYMFLTWISYMISHKEAVGKYIDGKEGIGENQKDENMAPKDLAENKGFILGSLLFIVGMVTGAYGLHLVREALTILGSVIFITGYVVAHYSTTGELL